jgi:hypothetical protein
MFAKRLFTASAFIVISSLLVAGCGGGQSEQTPPSSTTTAGGKADFRNVSWGMTKDQVRSLETAPPDPTNTDETKLVFKGKLLDKFDCSLFYIFSDEGKLVAGGYEMDALNTNFCGEDSQLSAEDQQLANKMKAVDFFHEVTQELTAKYGEPSENKANWYSTQLQTACEYDAKLGYAARDAVFFITKWARGDTLISQEMTKGKFKVLFIKR